LCRLIWNKYRKYKMRTYINTLHQTFRFNYTPIIIFVTKLRNPSADQMRHAHSDLRTCRVFSENVWCRNVKSMKDHGASLQWPNPPRALRQTSAKFQVKLTFKPVS
jgi:hypothetical protein